MDETEPDSLRRAGRQWFDPKAYFLPTLNMLVSGFRELETQVPPPIRKPWQSSFVFRYSEQTIQQAIIQKLARTLSGLRAVELLLEQGLYQEQGMIQRGLDELQDDVWFLSLAIIRNDSTPLHKQYLGYFWAEEFTDPSDIVGSHQSRGMVKREKIRSYINASSNENVARGNAAEKILTKAYSGFIHAASPHIMDMFGGVPAQFDVCGNSKPLRATAQEHDAFNYFYRGTLALAVAAKAFGSSELFEQLRTSADRLYAYAAGTRR